MRWFWRGMLVHALLLGSACGVTDTDEPTPIDTVVVTPPALQLMAGGTGALAADVTDAAGRVVRDRRVVWVSANPSIASVTDNGVVSAVSAGRVDIAASAEGKTGVASVTVVAPPPRVTSVRITPDRVSVFVAGEAGLAASAHDNNGGVITGRAVVWTTNNVDVAAVSQTGQVTGLAPGTAVITAVIEGVSGTATVTVTLAPVARVVVTPGDVSINEGKNTTLTARTMDASGHTLTGRAVSWSSSDTRIVTIDQSGLARGIRRGSAVITATSEGKFGTSTVRVQ